MNYNNMNNANININPHMTQEIKEVKQLTIIEQAKETAKKFYKSLPALEKGMLNKNEQEIKDLIEQWDQMEKYNKEAEEYNEKLDAIYKEYSPLFKQAHELNYKLTQAARAIIEPRISEAWEKEKTHSNFSSYNKCYELTEHLKKIEKKLEGTDEASRTLKDLLSYKWQKKGYYSNDFLDIEKKLKTRLQRIGAIEK